MRRDGEPGGAKLPAVTTPAGFASSSDEQGVPRTVRTTVPVEPQETLEGDPARHGPAPRCSAVSASAVSSVPSGQRAALTGAAARPSGRPGWRLESAVSTHGWWPGPARPSAASFTPDALHDDVVVALDRVIECQHESGGDDDACAGRPARAGRGRGNGRRGWRAPPLRRRAGRCGSGRGLGHVHLHGLSGRLFLERSASLRLMDQSNGQGPVIGQRDVEAVMCGAAGRRRPARPCTTAIASSTPSAWAPSLGALPSPRSSRTSARGCRTWPRPDDDAVASVTLVALVQTATSLPVFVFALPGGALADTLDRRRLLLRHAVPVRRRRRPQPPGYCRREHQRTFQSRGPPNRAGATRCRCERRDARGSRQHHAGSEPEAQRRQPGDFREKHRL